MAKQHNTAEKSLKNVKAADNAVINPLSIVDIVGQQKSTGYPSQGLTGTVLDSPSDGWETMAIAKEELIYGGPGFMIPCPTNKLMQPATGLVFVSQQYNADFAQHYTAENLVMVLQTYANQVFLQYGTSLMANIALGRQPLEFTVGRMNVVGNVRLQLDVYSMQDNLPAKIRSRLYVLKSSEDQLFPVYILNNDPAVTPDPALYIKTNFVVDQVLRQVANINAGTTSVQLINTL